MTIEEFMQKFEEVAPSYKWILSPWSGLIRTTDNCCPIEVVAGRGRGEYRGAAIELGLTSQTRRCIAEAADGATVIVRAYPKELRAEMLRITGLSEAA